MSVGITRGCIESSWTRLSDLCLLARAGNQTVRGFTKPAHFLRHEAASMKRIGGGGPAGRSASGKLRMTSSSAPTALESTAGGLT